MSSPDENAKQVFISHASANATQAMRIVRLMERRGISCWIAPRNVEPGTRYGEAIIRALESCHALFVLLSDEANASDAVTNEVERAFSLRKRIIPLRLKDIQPSHALAFFLGQAQWVDIWGGAIENKIDQLVTTVRDLAETSAAAAAAPAPAAPPPPQSGKRWAWWALAACAIAIVAVPLLVRQRHRSAESAPSGPLHPTAAPTTTTIPDSVADKAFSMPRYRAIVIGINAYDPMQSSGWEPLTTARTDAESVADLLEKRYGFQVQRLFDKQASRGAILAALDNLVSCGDQDACLVYYAGHGFYEDALGEGYWIPADARRKDGERLAKEYWLWNSTITKILGASMAQHILVIADSCYGGSMFRGVEGEPKRNAELEWYGRALNKPSRYLIASGDLEPVPDSAGKHSAFAQELIQYLQHTDRDVFSASDLGFSVRERVSTLTGQMVRMGPLAVSSHAGGEFVFIKPGTKTASLALASAHAPELAGSRAAPASPSAGQRQDRLRDALAAGRLGATNAAAALLAAAGNADQRLTGAVQAYLNSEQRARAQASVADLLTRMDARAKADTNDPQNAGSARPRIIACIGPDVRNDLGGIGADMALLYRIALRAELEAAGGLIVIERDALEQILQEMNLGSSDLADARVRTTLGRLLPAGMLLLADLVPMGEGEHVYARLVDTETSRILASFSASRAADEDLATVCAELAATIQKKAVQLRPLTARAALVQANRARAGIGRFHGASEQSSYELVQRSASTPAVLPGQADTVLGTARLLALGDETSEFAVEFAATPPPTAQTDLWVRETRH